VYASYYKHKQERNHMDRIILSLAQVKVLEDKLVSTGYERIVVENSNLENTIACQIDGKFFLIGANGAVADLNR
jgi:hypothetical protein